MEQTLAINYSQDLSDHAVIFYRREMESWDFRDISSKEIIRIKPNGKLFVNDIKTVISAVKEGVGVSCIPRFAVATAENGLVTLKRQEGQEERLILLDLMMPVMDGWQFIQTLKNRHQQLHAKIPIVVISAINDLDVLQKQYNCVVLRKPVTLQQSVTLTREHCDACQAVALDAVSD